MTGHDIGILPLPSASAITESFHPANAVSNTPQDIRPEARRLLPITGVTIP